MYRCGIQALRVTQNGPRGGDKPVTNEYGCEVFTQFLRNGINKKAAGFTGNSGVHRDQLVPERGTRYSLAALEVA